MHIYWLLLLMSFAVAFLRGIPFVMSRSGNSGTVIVGSLLALASHFMVAWVAMIVFNATAEFIGVTVTISYWLSFFSIVFWTTITAHLTVADKE